MKRLLLTGANGFIGRAVLERLDPERWQVIACSRQPAPAALPACVAEWRSVDLLDPEQACALMSETKASHWLHLAWYTAHGAFWNASQNLDWTVASLLLLKHFAAAGGKHAVMAGTCAEYDWRHGFCREDETPLNPQSLYGTAKDSLRRLAAAWCAGQGIRFAWGRVFSPFGPGEGRQRFIPAVIRAMLAGDAVRCSHGRQYRDFLHVADVANGFKTLLETDASGSFNIASATPRQLRDIVRLLGDITGWRGNPDFGAIPVADDEPPLLIGDNRKLHALGWEPSIELVTGLENAVNGWRDREQAPS
ncbi:MAG: NAD(P)-dependent oxidoreductase [Desulfobulbus sp.]|nr:NAD(P)-dependent oxidoreductase [Desulfobulbus sp.]